MKTKNILHSKTKQIIEFFLIQNSILKIRFDIYIFFGGRWHYGTSVPTVFIWVPLTG